MTSIRITMRHEARGTEYRAPIVPADAARLVGHGIALTVEESPQRVFATADYADAGCAITAPGSWAAAPEDAFILGLKELPRLPAALRHRHVFFGHAYKGQRAGPGCCAGSPRAAARCSTWNTWPTTRADGLPRSATGQATRALRSPSYTIVASWYRRWRRCRRTGWPPRCAARQEPARHAC